MSITTSMKRIAAGLNLGAIVAEGTITWTKVSDRWWTDGRGNDAGNRDIDYKLGQGATLVIDEITLETEEVSVFELETGDYVVVTEGFWQEGAGGSYFEENRSHQLWRVAGWTWHGPAGNSTVLLDAPEDLMEVTTRQMDGDDWEGDVRPIELNVIREDVIRLVLPGQDHTTWGYDWEDPNNWYGHFEFIDPPE